MRRLEYAYREKPQVDLGGIVKFKVRGRFHLLNIEVVTLQSGAWTNFSAKIEQLAILFE